MPVNSSFRKLALISEFVLLFFACPLLIMTTRSRFLMIGLLWIGGILTYKLYPSRTASDIRKLKHGVGWIALRFLILAPLITALAWYLFPESFLSFPKERPRIWITVMLLYPLLSVWPQEMIYRRFIFERYGPLFGQKWGYIAMSAIAFGFGHILLINWIAVTMCLIGGYLFASDYSKNRSLLLACLEHAIYGCLIFTIGLGKFFYTGAAWNSHPIPVSPPVQQVELK